ncbi:MAG TPA: hypothetical protein H9853_04565 [Candidatus Sphingobacterium stercoripullorum]|uniref:Uncharacterized protein n=1 Tax=Candidatus Sphingobacterium stercoripullorum TaxID=2838759 RepID=A0A9D1W7Y1_9SPHI|nr:hypothetical protein [Candidatus Sphingobacterium stercoripullorum]
MIKNEINKGIYGSGYAYSIEKLNFKWEIEWLANDQSKAFIILEDILNLLTDMRFLNSTAYT